MKKKVPSILTSIVLANLEIVDIQVEPRNWIGLYFDFVNDREISWREKLNDIIRFICSRILFFLRASMH